MLIALHNDFEGLKSLILHHSSLPSIDLVFSELLVEEIRFQSYSKKRIIYTSNPSILAIPSKPLSNNQNKPYTMVAFDECNFYN